MKKVKVYTDNGKSIYKFLRVGKRESGWEFVCLVKGSMDNPQLTLLIKQGYSYMTNAKAQNSYGDLPEEK